MSKEVVVTGVTGGLGHRSVSVEPTALSEGAGIEACFFSSWSCVD